MRKLHFIREFKTSEMPFCANRVDMSRNGFDETEDEDKVTCKLCLMRLGLIEDTRGNWDNRDR